MCDCNKTTNTTKTLQPLDARTLEQMRRDAIKLVRTCDRVLYNNPSYTIPERQR